MKSRLVRIAGIISPIVIAVVWLGIQRATPQTVHIRLRSDPYPMTAGPTTLKVSLVNSDGTPVNGAVVEVSGQMNHVGMLPVSRPSTSAANGEYLVPIVWPMMGEWTIDVIAQLPDERGTVQEQFEVFIYSILSYDGDAEYYKSVSETNAEIASIPSRELWIVIPQGTQEIVRMGQEDDVIPAEIRLNVNGQNVLVIRNDDIADHTIGPFFVRAGETVRQEFTQPAVFEGTCTIRHSAQVSIIVGG